MTTSGAVDAAATTEGCRYCWMCRQACPVGLVTARETYTPHAWALAIESVRRGQLSWTPEVVDALYACADCGLCQAHCVTDRPLPDAIVEARAGVAERGDAGSVVGEIDRRLLEYGNPYGVPGPPPASGAGATAVFVGDAAWHRGRAEVEAARRLLQAAGCDVVAIGDGRSTGQVASSLGLRSTAASLARAVVAAVAASGASTVLVLGPGDRWTFEHVYPRRLGVPWPGGVAVREVTDVLAEARAAGRLVLREANEGAWAYVDPCQTARVAPTRPAPRALLASVFGGAQARELFWREHRAHPCGSVGGLEFTHPDLAATLSEARLADARASGASWVVTDDPACLHHVRGRAPADLPVRGLYETLAGRL